MSYARGAYPQSKFCLNMAMHIIDLRDNRLDDSDFDVMFNIKHNVNVDMLSVKNTIIANIIVII